MNKRHMTDPKLALDHETAVKLTHTRTNPHEWIGTLEDGRRVYIVSSGRSLLITQGATLNDALQYMKAKKHHTVKLEVYATKDITTEIMLKATGLNVKGEVKEKDLDKAIRLPEPKK